MSRVGKNPITIPSGVEVTLADSILTAKGKLGELKLKTLPEVTVTVEGNLVQVEPASDDKFAIIRAHVRRASA